MGSAAPSLNQSFGDQHFQDWEKEDLWKDPRQIWVTFKWMFNNDWGDDQEANSLQVHQFPRFA